MSSELPPLAAEPAAPASPHAHPVEIDDSAFSKQVFSELAKAGVGVCRALPAFALAISILIILGLFVAGRIPHTAWIAAGVALYLCSLAFSFWGGLLRGRRGIQVLTWPERVSFYFLALGALFFTYPFMGWTARSLPLFLQVIIIAFYAMTLGVYAGLLSTRASRPIAFSFWTRPLGKHAPAPLVATLFSGLLVFFVALTVVLQRHRALGLTSRTGDPPGFDAIGQFYIWHALNAVPVLDVTKTLKWDRAALRYSDAYTGLFVLAFKALLIGPIIGGFLQYWRGDHGSG